LFTSLFIIKKKKSKAARITIGCLAGLISVIVLFFGYFYPYWNSTVYKNFSHVPVEYDSTISKEDALEDLSVMMSRLRRTHPLLVRGLTPEVKEKYEEAFHYIENKDELYLYELDRVLEPIASALHDAHTEVNPVYATRKSMCRIYPHNMDGYRVKKINGISIEDLLDQHRDLYSFEREDWGLSNLRGDISTLEGLTMLGIDVSSGVTYTYLTPDGEYVDDVAYPDDYWTIDRINEYYQIEDEYVPFCSYEIDKDKSLAIFTLRSCTYNDEYRNCLKEMFTKVKEEGIENVAFDIRGNGGGSSMVANELLKYLPIDRYKCIDSKERFGPLLLDLSPKDAKNKRYNELTFEGEFFLLVDKYSFSSARNISELIKDNKLGTLIGESLSNSTDCCGNLVRFRLPNSGFSLNVSHTKYNRPDENCEEVFVLPDIECDSDDAMEVLYSMIM